MPSPRHKAVFHTRHRMPSYKLQFVVHTRGPYIQELFDYTCDGSEGSFEFNGYYYVDDGENEDFRDHQKKMPTTEVVHVKKISDAPPVITYTEEPSWLAEPDGSRPLVQVRHTKHEILDEHTYVIEIYKRKVIENTDRFSKVRDGDEEMDICFFPTDRQRLYFRVLEKDPSKDRIAEIIHANWN